MWAIPEKMQTGEGGGGLRTWIFQGYCRKSMWKFQGYIKKEVGFPGMFKKKSFGISMGLGF